MADDSKAFEPHWRILGQFAAGKQKGGAISISRAFARQIVHDRKKLNWSETVREAALRRLTVRIEEVRKLKIALANLGDHQTETCYECGSEFCATAMKAMPTSVGAHSLDIVESPICPYCWMKGP